MPIAVELVSKEKRVFVEEAADMVLIPATEGIMGVLPNHAPVLTTLADGEVVIRKGTATESFIVYGGVVDIRPNKVTILAELAESAYDLDTDVIERARSSATESMAKGQGSAEGYNQAMTLALRRAELAAKVMARLRQYPGVRIMDQETREAKR